MLPLLPRLGHFDAPFPLRLVLTCRRTGKLRRRGPEAKSEDAGGRDAPAGVLSPAAGQICGSLAAVIHSRGLPAGCWVGRLCHMALARPQ